MGHALRTFHKRSFDMKKMKEKKPSAVSSPLKDGYPLV